MKSDIEKFLYQNIKSPEKILGVFEELLEYSELEAYDYFTKSGETPCDFIIMKSGIIRSYFLNEDGREITRAFFTPGYISGATSAMMQRTKSEVNYQALTKVTGYKGNFFELKELIAKHHELSSLYVKTLEDAYLKAENVIFDISTNSATERYLLLKERIPKIDNLITQKHIASYLNVSPVQLSRKRKKLLFG